MNNLFLTAQDIADLLGIHSKTVYKLAPEIPGYLKLGGNVLFNRQTFEAGTKGLQPKPKKEAHADPDPHKLL